jgi:hypothetical protein
VSGALQAAREALAGSIHEGFVFAFVALTLTIVAAVLVKNIRLEGFPEEHPARKQRRGRHPEVTRTRL